MLHVPRWSSIGIRTLFLLALAAGLVLQRGTLLYVVQDEPPLLLESTAAAVEGRVDPGTLVQFSAVPDYARGLGYQRYGTTSYWFPFVDGDLRVLARASRVADLPPEQGGTPNIIVARLARFESIAFSGKVREAFASRGVQVPSEAVVLLVGEDPQHYHWIIYYYLIAGSAALLLAASIAYSLRRRRAGKTGALLGMTRPQ